MLQEAQAICGHASSQSQPVPTARSHLEASAGVFESQAPQHGSSTLRYPRTDETAQ